MTTGILTRPAKLTLSVDVRGSFPEGQLHLRGTGLLDEAEGISTAIFELLKVPAGIDPRGFGAYLFTGYPNACRIEPGGTSPFFGDRYHYDRIYNYRSGASKPTRLAMSCQRDVVHESMTADFELSGSIPKWGKITGVSPIYELWTPSDDSLVGSFAVAWVGPNSQAVGSAEASSTYHPAKPRALGDSYKYRFISLQSSITDDGLLKVYQTSHLI